MIPAFSPHAMKSSKDSHVMLSRAQVYANAHSTCAKVKVASLIVNSDFVVTMGCNHGVERNCCKEGCHRIEKYGENSKLHRLPSDCVSIHSEVDAICKAANHGVKLEGAAIFVTRYPCEACARAITQSGIRKVVYGRKEGISEMTEKMFDSAGIEVVHVEDWDYDDNNS